MDRRLSSGLLVVCGVILVGIGLYFVLWRPPLLPEDVRFIGSSLTDIEGAMPGLSTWLQKVFWVLGGYVISAGLFTVYIGGTLLRSERRGALPLLALTGLSSIGWMTGVNWLIDSDFKWPLLGVVLLWGAGLALRGAGR